MADRDPQSSGAEDRAWERWANDDTSQEAETFFELAIDEDRWEHVYRQGFRAGITAAQRATPRKLSPTASYGECINELDKRVSALEEHVSRIVAEES